MITASQVSQLREKTGVGMMDAKKALEEAVGDEGKAIEILRKKGLKAAEKRSGKDAREGVVEAYVHTNAKVGVLVALACETDFVARNEEFRALAHEIALHAAAMNPRFLKSEDVPAEILEKEKEIYRDQLKAEKKPEAMFDKIIEGKIQKFYKDNCLLKQQFVKDDTKSIEDLIIAATAKWGEKIELKGFSRIAI